MKVSIVGITGYSGLELVRILHNHPKVELVSIHATKDLGKKLSDLYPYLLGVCDLMIEAFDAAAIMQQADLVFFATPSGVAKGLRRNLFKLIFLLLIYLGIIACRQMFIKNGIKNHLLSRVF